MKINEVLLLDFILRFLLVYICTFIGAYINEVYSILCNKSNKIRLKKIIITCTTLSFLSIGISEYLIESIGVNFFITICFLCGLSCYKILNKFFDGSFLKLIITIIIKTKKDIFESIMDFLEDTIDDERENKRNNKDNNNS